MLMIFSGRRILLRSWTQLMHPFIWKIYLVRSSESYSLGFHSHSNMHKIWEKFDACIPKQKQELKQLADEVRSEIAFIISRKCQPCGPGCSVVELTIAIHYVFNAPMDKILWDAGQHVRHLSVTVFKCKISVLLNFVIFNLFSLNSFLATGVCAQDSYRKALSISYY